MADWQKLIGRCFGGPGFASHHTDRERAFELLLIAREEKLGWEELETEFMKYLGPERMYPPGDGARQILKAKDYFKPWLLDD